LLKPLLLEEKSFLIVVENDSKAQTYKKIGKGLGIIMDIVDNFSDFVDLSLNKKGAFIVNKDIFNIDIVDKNFQKNWVFTLKK
jgi:predicted secreted acid phosphatase